MINPLSVATSGWLNGPLSIATDGYITIEVIISDGGGGWYRKTIKEVPIKNRKFADEEEDIVELLTIIKAFLLCQNH